MYIYTYVRYYKIDHPASINKDANFAPSCMLHTKVRASTAWLPKLTGQTVRSL